MDEIFVSCEDFERKYVSRRAYDDLMREAQAQSEMMQRDWLTPLQADALRARVKELQDALEWYADPINYRDGKPGEERPLLNTPPSVMYWHCDHGKIAREALK